MSPRNRQLSVTASAVAFAVATVVAGAVLVGGLADGAVAMRPIIGDFTGDIAPAGPVYRLPAMHVVADRVVELVRIEREERSATRALDCVSMTLFPHVVEEVA